MVNVSKNGRNGMVSGGLFDNRYELWTTYPFDLILGDTWRIEPQKMFTKLQVAPSVIWWSNNI